MNVLPTFFVPLKRGRKNRLVFGSYVDLTLNIMKKGRAGSNQADKNKSQPYRVRLPGFISDEEIGLGDAIRRVTSGFGIKPCGGCERRAAALNRWMVFSGRRPK